MHEGIRLASQLVDQCLKQSSQNNDEPDAESVGSGLVPSPCKDHRMQGGPPTCITAGRQMLEAED